jgi:prevent-host-death family protein
MEGNTADVSAFEAKTRLSELLRETERGRSFVIRRRGKPVARLLPPVREGPIADRARLLTAFRAVRARIPGTLRVRELVEEGRRH